MFLSIIDLLYGNLYPREDLRHSIYLVSAIIVAVVVVIKLGLIIGGIINLFRRVFLLLELFVIGGMPCHAVLLFDCSPFKVISAEDHFDYNPELVTSFCLTHT